MIKKFLTVLVIFFVFVSCSLLSCTEQLTILHTNDTHSHLYSFGTFNRYGGMARMSYLIKKLKRQNRNVLTVNAGDVFVGTFAFNKYLGYAELKIMEELYDVMCLGNHEFDLGVEALTGILSGGLTGGAPVVLPILCANVDLGQCPGLNTFVKPSMIQQVGPLKIGLVGVVTTDEFNYSQEVNDILTDPYEAAGAEASYLKSIEGCDVVICLSHLGKVPDVEGLSEVPGIDIIIGGHSHDAIFKPIIKNKKIIVQAGAFGKYVGELKVRVKKGKVKVLNYKLHPINRRVRRDWTLVKTLFDLKKGIRQDPRFGPVYTKPIAWARWNLEERWEEGNPHRDTALGNLIADAIRDGVDNSGMVPQDGSLIALEANGYIAHRIYRGMVVGNDIMRTVPYGYDLESGLGFKIDAVLLAGAHIFAGLEYTVSMVEFLDDLSLQVSGLKFEYDSSKPPGSRVDPYSVMIYNGDQWQPLNLEGLYWVAITEQLLGFLRSLGVEPYGMIETGLFEYNVVRDYMRKLKILKYKSEGRIIDTALLPGAGK